MRIEPAVFAITTSFLSLGALRAQEAPPAAVTAPATRAVQLRVEPHIEAGQLRLAVATDATPVRDTFVLEAGKHALADLIDRAAAWLGRNYLRQESDFQQGLTIELQTGLQLDRDGLEDTLSQLLYVKGFAIIALNAELGLYQVVQLNGPQRQDVSARARYVTNDELFAQPSRMEQVLTYIELRNINAMTAATATRPFFSQSATSTGALLTGNLGDNRTMIVQGFRPQVAAAVRLIRLADELAGRALEAQRIERLEQRIEQLEGPRQGTPAGR